MDKLELYDVEIRLAWAAIQNASERRDVSDLGYFLNRVIHLERLKAHESVIKC